MKKILEKVMPPKTALAVEVKQGQIFRITDIEGQQVADMGLWNLDNLREKLSTSNSRTRYFFKVEEGYHPRDHIEEGDYLMSTLCRPMMTFLKETAEPKGVHDTCNRMCNRFHYEMLGWGPRDGCHENIGKAVAPYGLGLEDVPDPMNIFMNYYHDCRKGCFVIDDPITKAGDYIEFRAEMNCLVGLSNCPYEGCSAGRCKPLKVEVFHDENYKPEPVLSPVEWLDKEMKKRGLKK